MKTPRGYGVNTDCGPVDGDIREEWNRWLHRRFMSPMEQARATAVRDGGPGYATSLPFIGDRLRKICFSICLKQDYFPQLLTPLEVSQVQ